jgi:hypothetical protein
MLEAPPGALGSFLQLAGAALGAREPGLSHDQIFPLPWIPRLSSQQKVVLGRSLRPNHYEQLTVTVAVLNWMHGGDSFQICRLMPSRAQGRILRRLCDNVLERFSRLDGRHVDRSFIRKFLRLDRHSYGARQVAKPLGVQAGVPTAAATCDPANALSVFGPEIAEI